MKSKQQNTIIATTATTATKTSTRTTINKHITHQHQYKRYCHSLYHHLYHENHNYPHRQQQLLKQLEYQCEIVSQNTKTKKSNYFRLNSRRNQESYSFVATATAVATTSTANVASAKATIIHKNTACTKNDCINYKATDNQLQQQQLIEQEHLRRKKCQYQSISSPLQLPYQQFDGEHHSTIAAYQHQCRQLDTIELPSSGVEHLKKITSKINNNNHINNSNNNNNNSNYINYHTILPNSFYFILCHLLWLILLFDMFDSARSDWLMDCGDCHCKWNSGKKTADCKNLTLTAVPENLSNEIQVLDLSFNRIIYLEQNAFLIADLQNLHKLYIRNSSLQQINPATFTQLEILIELDLSNNLLRSLSSDLFGKLVKVRAIVLNGNLLEELGDGVFQNLKYLHKIELKDNRLRHIGTHTFINVPLLSQIYLNNNRLSFLRKESFEMLKRLTALSLDGNLWNCTCELQVFRDFVLRRNLYTPPTDCYYPVHLRGMLWIEDQPEAFACRPRIIFPTKGASINTSKENVTLVCRVHASPNTRIIWDYNKQLYRSGNTITGVANDNYNYNRVHIQVIRDEEAKDREFGRDVYVSRLTIVGAEKSDEGIYTCIAENAGGKDTVQMTLLIETSSSSELFQGNLAIVIALMALALLSVSIFLGVVTCCIYKRFIGTIAARQHRHHRHLDLSVGDPMSSMGTIVTNQATATTTVTSGTDVMLGMMVNGLDDTSKQYKKHNQLIMQQQKQQQQQQQKQQKQQHQKQQKQTILNGGVAFSHDEKYCELMHNCADKMREGNGGSDAIGNDGVGDNAGSGVSPLIEVGMKGGNDIQLGHAEKSYLAQSNEELLHIKYTPGRLLDDINRTMMAVSQTVGHNNDGDVCKQNNKPKQMNIMPPITVNSNTLTATNTIEFQPDLLPAHINNKINNNSTHNNNNQQQQQQQQRHEQINELYSPATTPGSGSGAVTCKTIIKTKENQQIQKQQQQQQQQQQSLYSPFNNSLNSKQLITTTATAATTTTTKNSKVSINRSKYNTSAQQYLQAKYGTVNKRSMPENVVQDRLRATNVKGIITANTTVTTTVITTATATTTASVTATLTSSTTATTSLMDNLNNCTVVKSLTMPQRTVCGATTIATPTDTNVSYEYRQPPPPPYNAAHRTSGNLLLGRHSDLTQHNNNKYNQMKDQGYRETISTCYDMGRPTIVTASSSLNFPPTITGYNNSSSNISSRRQLL